MSALPPPPPGRVGWPWTEESTVPDAGARLNEWPRVTIVTPSFNQAAFLEETIRSVLLQRYPDLEYFVLDGGSTDNSAEIIRKYEPWLAGWSSAKDDGQSDAINRGMAMGTGIAASWVNSDDLLCRNALVRQAAEHGFDPRTAYVGVCIHIDVKGRELARHQGRVSTLEELLRIGSIWRQDGAIDQPAVLFPREAYLQAGGLDPANHQTMDYELWGRLLAAGVRFCYTNIDFGCFRKHEAQKTHDLLRQTELLVRTARKLLSRSESLSDDVRDSIRREIEEYAWEYPRLHWRSSGRLARIGLPHGIVNVLRRLRASVAGGQGG